MSTLTRCPPCRSVVKHDASIHHAKRSWNATAAYATGERGPIYRGCARATGTQVSQCTADAQLLAAAAEDGRNQDRRRFPTCASCIAARFVLRRASLRPPLGPPNPPSVRLERPQYAFALRALERFGGRCACFERRRGKLAISIRPAGLRAWNLATRSRFVQ